MEQREESFNCILNFEVLFSYCPLLSNNINKCKEKKKKEKIAEFIFEPRKTQHALIFTFRNVKWV